MPSFKRSRQQRSSNICYSWLAVDTLGRTRIPEKLVFILAFGIISVIVLLYKHGLYVHRFQTRFQEIVFVQEKGNNYELGIKDELILNVLQRLNAPITDTDMNHIFKGDLSNNLTWEFDFSEISKRRFGRSYIEQTSFDPNARSGDFYNPVGIDSGGLVLFEDHGPGIFKRLLWFHRTNYDKLNMDYVTFEIDGKELCTLPLVWGNKTYPLFPLPFIRPNGMDNQAGFYMTFPISYSKSLRIIMKWKGSSKLNEERAWNESKICHRKRTRCDPVAYYAVIATKLVHGANPETNFKNYISNTSTQSESKYFKSVTKAVSEMAKSPERYGPGLRSECKLTCQNVQPGNEVVIYRHAQNAKGKVIQSLRFRLYDVRKKKLVISKNWRRVLITMRWDGKDPQVNDIPLAGLFITGLDFIREVKGLTTGFRNMTCDVQGERASEVTPNEGTAYLYYEMPFWKAARISVRIPHGYESAIICSQISTKELNIEKYHPRLTGYFNAQLRQQLALDYFHHKTILHLENQWGHVVGINFFMRNNRIASTHELDVIIEIDDANVPVFSGTGLEDFFHYVHDFKANKNRTAPFNGAPFYYRNGRSRILRCYRHNILDPILFTTGIHIYLESQFNRGDNPLAFKRQFFKTTTSFNQTVTPDLLFAVVLYYGGKGSGGIITDKVIYHKINESLSSRLQFQPAGVDSFHIRSNFENQPGILFDRMVVSMKPGQRVTHKFKVYSDNVGVILRREYRTVVPNQKAEITVDGENAGLWFCPQRAMSEDFSLRFNDHLLPPEKTAGKESIEVTLLALTRWETVSIQALSVVLSN